MMGDNDRLKRIEDKLDVMADSLADLREEVAGYRATIRFLKWVLGLVTMPTVGGMLWMLKKIGILAS